MIPHPPRAVLDTDTFNEVDDQFALAHLLLSPGQVALEAVYAAPFSNARANTPAEGMERSYEEIQRVLDLVNPRKRPEIFRGSTRYLPSAGTPVESDAVADLVERAMAVREGRLHVLAIAAATNIASALLAEPRIVDKIVVVWLGGHAPCWNNTNEFNLRQDLLASRLLLDSGVPLVLLPCMPVASHLLVTVPELEVELAPLSRLGAYLTAIVRDYNVRKRPAWSKPLWDVAASAWMIDSKWITTERAPSPFLRDDLTWQTPAPSGRHLIDIACKLDRDAIFADFFTKAALS